MSDFAGMEDMLQDFLLEASELLASVDNQLVDLEKRPDDRNLLNEIFRGFHTIKGGAGFLGANELVALCHRTENLFDRLRNGELRITAEIMDSILASTATVRNMFGYLGQSKQPPAADPRLLADLDAALANQPPPARAPAAAVAAAAPAASAPPPAAGGMIMPKDGGPNWEAMYNALVNPNAVPSSHPAPESVTAHVPKDSPAVAALMTPPSAMTAADPDSQAREALMAEARQSQPAYPTPGSAGPAPLAIKENTIRIDTNRLDQVLNLSGEIGLTKNRLTTLRSEILQGKTDQVTIRALDEAISQLDLLVSDLQNAVMKTRMQPIGRLFQKYPRMARDLARQLGKDVELIITGEETEIDKTMIEDLNDPLVHLVRNAVDHGIETREERDSLNKPQKAIIRLDAAQVGDHIIIEISDDGRGMKPDVLRRKAVEKGLIDLEQANALDDKQALQLIFLPGFSTKDQISSISGRGVGMDVVKTNIQKLNGRLDITSVPGEGTTISISLPLTLAIMPVLVVALGQQQFAVPLAMVREIIPLKADDVQEISGRATMVVRDEVLPLRSLSNLLSWPNLNRPQFGVLMQTTSSNFILAIDNFVGRDDVVIKPLKDIRPRGVAGATLSGDGSVVLVLDMEELLTAQNAESRKAMFAAQS